MRAYPFILAFSTFVPFTGFPRLIINILKWIQRSSERNLWQKAAGNYLT
jgi:hypothetical protein